jgi:hypothetical protein
MTQKKEAGEGTGVHTGPASSKTLKYARVVNSPDELEQVESGDNLVTTNHDVIRKWAEERGAVPAVVAGTEHPETGTLGVLRFDFPPHGDDDRIRHVSWDEWFETFDRRRLNFIFQETRADGRQSNFFRLDNPERESA